MTHQRGRPLPELLRTELREQVARDGERRVRERIGLARGAWARCLAGLNVYEGTIAIVERGLSIRVSA